ncbi:MAG: DNA replication and repair protein RecF [Coriobacteriales bacterium]|nr:DNA replication and repair protein RecF [Coriobacteriales bacterium]
MGLQVQSLKLRDWRSFEACDIAFSGMTILHGRNAMGKTNTVEALQMLTAGQSFRKPKPSQQILQGAESAKISARLEGDGRVVDLSCVIEPTRRLFTRNGKRIHAGDVPESLMSVLFNPDDLSFVKRGASYRRDELDGFGRQANRGYAKVLAAYQRSVEQRNRLLKDDYLDQQLLGAWDASVALGGATLLQSRLRLFARLRDHMVNIYREISEGEELNCRYECTLGDDVDELSRSELCDRFAERLEQLRPDELRRQQTLVGPQRDDVSFTINGRDARAFGSQGQQRSIVLAWKMAEVELCEEVVGDKPLLLLDDVMSELDEVRRDAVTRFVQGGIQTVITTTNLGYFPNELLERAKVVQFNG